MTREQLEKDITEILNPNLLKNRNKYYWESSKEIVEYLEKNLGDIFEV